MTTAPVPPERPVPVSPQKRPKRPGILSFALSCRCVCSWTSAQAMPSGGTASSTKGGGGEVKVKSEKRKVGREGDQAAVEIIGCRKMAMFVVPCLPSRFRRLETGRFQQRLHFFATLKFDNCIFLQHVSSERACFRRMESGPLSLWRVFLESLSEKRPTGSNAWNSGRRETSDE